MDTLPVGLYPLTLDAPIPKEQFDKMYPAALYDSRKNFALHFLIALGQPKELIEKFIVSLKEKNPTRLTQGDPLNSNLTPLHLAAMKGSVVVAQLILDAVPNKDQKKQMIQMRDKRCWTPLDFATLTSPKLYQIFMGFRAQINEKNPFSRDLLALCGRENKIRATNKLSLEDSDSKKIMLVSKASQAVRHKVFGQQFFHTDFPVFKSDQFLENLWIENYTITQLDKFLMTPYANYKKNAPTLLISPCQELQNLVPSAYECRAMKKINKGQVVSEYSGLSEEMGSAERFMDSFKEETIHKGEYYLGGMNSRSIGNESRFFNCGFPNLACLSTTSEGLSRRLMIAIDDIDANEPILWDYGSSMKNLTFGTQILLGKDRMNLFFKNLRTEQLLPLLMEVEAETLDQFIVQQNILTRIHYVYNNPTALLYLCFNKTKELKVWKTFFDTNLMTEWKKTNALSFLYIRTIFDILDSVAAIKDVDAWVLQKLEKIPLLNILKGLEMISQGQSFAEVDAFLETYDFKKDDQFCFNNKRLATTATTYYKEKPIDISILEKSLENCKVDSDKYEINKLAIANLK